MSLAPQHRHKPTVQLAHSIKESHTADIIQSVTGRDSFTSEQIHRKSIFSIATYLSVEHCKGLPAFVARSRL